MDRLKGFLRTVSPMDKIPEIYQNIYLAEHVPEQRGPYT
jgi:hypothetical protein